MVNKITTPPTPNEIVGKINEIIDDKADNSTVVHKAGTETITGFKTLSAGAKITTTQSGAILELESAASDTNLLLRRTNGTTCVLESGNSMGLFGTYSNNPLQIRTNYVNRMEFGTNGSVTLATAPSENSNNNQVATTAWTNSKIPTVNNSTITLTQGGTTKGSFTLNQSTGTTIELDAGGAGGYHPDLLSFQWSDHLLNNVSWLRADTFSWQDGTVYAAAYNHLSADILGKTLQSETIGAVTVQFYLADDGHKICPASEESKVASIYTNTGVAWYYILDKTNKRFKLPRENPVREVLEQRAPVVGNGNALGLTNGTISGGLGVCNYNWSNPQVQSNSYNAVGTSGELTSFTVKQAIGVSTDPEKSGLVVDFSEATGCYKGKKYLYFYVGNYTQEAIEQTAGLNAELFNSKLDVSTFNATPHIVETYKNGNNWYRLYSDGWIEQGGFINSMPNNTNYTLNILKPFKDTNYNVQCVSSAKQHFMCPVSKTESTITFHTVDVSYNTNTGCYWFSCGY